MQRANRGSADCDWPKTRPRPMWLDMGIYWRQLHQSAPHLINEPEHCMDQEVYISKLYLRQLIESATGIQRTHLCFSVMRRPEPFLRHRNFAMCSGFPPLITRIRKVRKVYFSCQLYYKKNKTNKKTNACCFLCICICGGAATCL